MNQDHVGPNQEVQDCIINNPEKEAIRIRNAYKSYGFGKYRTGVFQSLDMTVAVGSMYLSLIFFSIIKTYIYKK